MGYDEKLIKKLEDVAPSGAEGIEVTKEGFKFTVPACSVVHFTVKRQ